MTLANAILEANVFNLFNSFSTSTWFVLFEVIFLLRFNSLSSKSVFITKFVWDNRALKTSAANLLNSEVSIYLS